MKTYDVLVVGAGIAGLVAAVRCAEQGLAVAVLEQGEQERYACNTRFARGAFHLARRKVTTDPAILKQAILDVTGGFISEAWANALARDGRHAIEWLKLQGVRFIKGGSEDWAENFLAPPTPIRTGLNWQGRGPDVMLRTLRAQLEHHGGTLLLGHRAGALQMRAGKCTGLEVVGKGVFEAEHIILCDGGFQGNLDLLRKYVSPAPERLLQRGASTGMGDALRMAIDIGADVVGMENFYGHVLSQEAFENDHLWPYPTIDLICNAAILVDGAGQRFVDEGLGGVYLANRIARLQDPLSAMVIFDQKIWETAGSDFMLPPNPHLVLAGGLINRANSIAELAAQLSVDSAQLERTVARYNTALRSGTLSAETPARTTTRFAALPIIASPFYSLRICAGITYTMGGLRIDDAGKVLARSRDTIPGLYASGCTAGGIEGGENSGYLSGLTKCATMSLKIVDEIIVDKKEAARASFTPALVQ